MKIYKIIIILMISSFSFILIDYNLFTYLLSLIWYIVTLLIIYAALKFSKKFKFIQFNLKEMKNSFKAKTSNKVSPLSSLNISLAAKIGVGSLSGVALCLYYGGIESIFWLSVFSIFISINTYVECLLGFECREEKDGNYLGGPSFYIKKKLKSKKLSNLYSVLLILTYGIFFLSIQSNTIVNTLSIFKIENVYIVISLAIFLLIILIFGFKGILKTNTLLVPLMLIFYFLLGIKVIINCHSQIPIIMKKFITSPINYKKMFPAIMIGLQKSVFITESSLGTSAISASTCDSNPKSQALLEVFGIYIIIFLVCFTTFIIISTSDYSNINFENINGIDLLIYAFTYHFGKKGILNLSIVTILFAISTIISSYFFVETNIKNLFNKKTNTFILKIIFLLIVIISCFVSL